MMLCVYAKARVWLKYYSGHIQKPNYTGFIRIVEIRLSGIICLNLDNDISILLYAFHCFSKANTAMCTHCCLYPHLQSHHTNSFSFCTNQKKTILLSLGPPFWSRLTSPKLWDGKQWNVQAFIVPWELILRTLVNHWINISHYQSYKMYCHEIWKIRS